MGVCPLVKKGLLSDLSRHADADLYATWGVHPEFIFSKQVNKVTINIYEATKFSQMESEETGFFDSPLTNPNGEANFQRGERVIGAAGNEDRYAGSWGADRMREHKRLWKAVFNLGGGNHILPNAPAKKFKRFCDARPYHVWDGGNIGNFRNHHIKPSLFSFFDVHIDGTTPTGQHFHDTMKVMLDRRPAFQ